MSIRRRASSGSGAGQPAPESRPRRSPGGGHGRALVLLAFQLRVLGVTLLALSLLVGVAPFTQPGARAAPPRVAIIVGPVGSFTDAYRAEAEEAAAAARRFTDDVVTAYSPHATWSAARAALRGASIVVYLGHGNGFPSPYGRTLNPRSQDGLGLNPVAGADDTAHQYFGEAYLARDVKLAPNAVVVLSHLCYASGNSEPGLPEGPLETAQERVDNFAAGWVAAGASAVIADGHLGPEYYVRSILEGRGTVEEIWRSAPNFHDHVVAFASGRSVGLTALLDPTQVASEFFRSLVTRAALRADEVARGAALRDVTIPGSAESPPPPRSGPEVTRARLEGIPVAGSAVELVLTFGAPGIVSPGDLRVGVRWTPLQLWARQAAPAPAALEPPPSAAAETPTAAESPALATPEPTPAAPPDPKRTLVTAESPGDVVVLAEAKAGPKGLRATLEVPPAPGLYRLVATLHGADDVALDAATQDRIPALVVHVTGSLSAIITAPEHRSAVTGAALELPVAVLNSGTVPWSAVPEVSDPEEPSSEIPLGSQPQLVGHWLRLDDSGGTGGRDATRARIEPAPGATERTTLRLVAPDLPGEYLLILDVVSPLAGSLAAAGGDLVVVRVTVEWPAPAPSTTPEAEQPAAPAPPAEAAAPYLP